MVAAQPGEGGRVDQRFSASAVPPSAACSSLMGATPTAMVMATPLRKSLRVMLMAIPVYEESSEKWDKVEFVTGE